MCVSNMEKEYLEYLKNELLEMALTNEDDKARKRLIEKEIPRNYVKLLAIADTHLGCYQDRRDILDYLANKVIQNDVDYVIHLASNTHPLQYSLDPIGTITTNVFGTYNTLEFAKKQHAVRYAFASSNEIYGENRGDKELFDESYCGYIDSNTLRAGYPESKRCSEALCQAFNKQENIDVVIPRLTRSYGPTMLMSDTKAISQFIKKALANEDIVLKSEG